MAITYKEAGVDTEAGGRFVKEIAPLVKSTFSSRVITDIGGFGALYSGKFPEMKDPVLVSGTDGVGTKLQIARMMNRHDTIGIDAVAMCVNDIITSGARPLFFLDYISCGKLNHGVLVDVVRGVAEGCKQGRCSLVGGETAEHPGVMEPDDYDIAGFAVGVVDRDKIINGAAIQAGDRIIGFPSSGIHSNGYSLVRKIFFEVKDFSVDQGFPELKGTLGEELLAPTRIYTDAVLSCLKAGTTVKGIIHVTGGGFYENIPRILPEGTSAQIDASSFTVSPVFKILQREGNISPREMFSTFNMGIGLIMIAAPDECTQIIQTVDKRYAPRLIGEVVSSGAERVVITGT